MYVVVPLAPQLPLACCITRVPEVLTHTPRATPCQTFASLVGPVSAALERALLLRALGSVADAAGMDVELLRHLAGRFTTQVRGCSGCLPRPSPFCHGVCVCDI